MSTTRSAQRYPQLAASLPQLRARAGIATQADLAALMEATQQTVSRWEKGESRPREHQVPRLASVLGADAAELMAAADYGASVALASPVDKPFPVHALTPDSFERFCFYMLQRLYRQPDEEIHRAGESGHAQSGIDISVRGPGWLHTFQCKRVGEFGPQKVAKAVADHSLAADKKYLLLSCVASPAAREAIAAHPGWDIWDREDISSKVRTLPLKDQRDLVRVFFPGHRRELLGEVEDSPWLSVEQFFEPFTDTAKVFNHNWTLVGRTEEAAKLIAALEAPTTRLTMMTGPAGWGKSRLLLEVLRDFNQRHPKIDVWALSQTDALTPRHLEELGRNEKLLVVDDAHEREDLGALIRHCADTANNSKLLLVLRPYGRALIQHQATNQALQRENIQHVELARQRLEDVTALAKAALAACCGPVEAAPKLAQVTFGSPLTTILGAQVMAKSRLHPDWIHLDADFKDQVLARYEQVIAGGIVTGQDVERLRSVLRIVALVQPIMPDDPELLRLITAVESLPSNEASRLLRVLIDAGVLFKRGLRYRLAPDLLADSIIERYCLDSAGQNGYAARVIDQIGYNEGFLTNLLLNLGKLDWRRTEGDTSNSELLASIWPKLQHADRLSQPHIKAAAAVAFYQPRQALEFAERLIRAGHGGNSTVCSVVRHAAFNLEYVEQACELLWQAATTAAGTNSERPALTVLKELASFEPGKPSEFMEKVANFAIEALDSPQGRKGDYAPFEILEGAIAKEGHRTSMSNSFTATMKAYVVPPDAVLHIHEKVVAALVKYLTQAPVTRAVHAARALQRALLDPWPALGLVPSDAEFETWATVRQQALKTLLQIVQTQALPAVVVVRLAVSVCGRSRREDDDTRGLAEEILGFLNRDLETRLTRGLLDGWGHRTWPIDLATHTRPTHEADMRALLSDLRSTYPKTDDLIAFVSNTYRQIEDAGVAGIGEQQHLINRLIGQDVDVARAIVQQRLDGQQGPLVAFAGVGLSVLLRHAPEEAHRLANELLGNSDPSSATAVAEAYARFEPAAYTSQDLMIVRRFFASKDANVLRYAPSMLRHVGKSDPKLGVELVCLVDFKVAGACADEFFSWVGNSNELAAEAITDEQLRQLVAGLGAVGGITDYWVWSFLRLATQRVPDAVIDLAISRLESSAKSHGWSRTFLASPHDAEQGLELLKVPGWSVLLAKLLKWGLDTYARDEYLPGFGKTVLALCGNVDADGLAMLLSWMQEGGTAHHAEVLAAVLKEMPKTFVRDHPSFVCEVLQAAHGIGLKSEDAVRSALYAATAYGTKLGTPGEPFPSDVELEEYADQRAEAMSKFEPAYKLYVDLRKEARENIARQLKEKAVIDAEVEETN